MLVTIYTHIVYKYLHSNTQMNIYYYTEIILYSFAFHAIKYRKQFSRNLVFTSICIQRNLVYL